MPEHVTYHDADLPAHLRWQVLSFLRIEWPFIFRGANRLSKHIHDPAIHPVHFAFVEQDVLLSYATVVSMDLNHAGETYKVYGLANVLTYPPYRHEGHGSRIVQAATTYIRASNGDIAALFCDPELKSFYTRSGWEAIDRAPTLIRSTDNPEPFDALKMMLFLSPKGKAGRPMFEHQPWYIPYHW
jgi:predicted N-acetyltransferase YhbS